MRLLIQYLLVSLYAILPVGTFYWAVTARTRHARSGPLVSFILSCIGALLIGVAFFFVNSRLLEYPVRAVHPWFAISWPALIEAARFIYFVVGAICLVKATDRLLFYAACRLARVPLTPAGRPRSPGVGRAVLCLIAQRFVMLGFGIAFVIALLMSYRPHVRLRGTPADYALAYAPCHFAASDGISLKGWWIDAAPLPSALDADDADLWGKRTVLLCHGIGSGKERQIDLAHYLARRGFNVFAFDFRAHGESAGNFISYGDRERLDVLAAISWIRSNHHSDAQRIFGIGINTGAAALLAAAAEPGVGKGIDALVLYEPFTRFDALVDSATDDVLPKPVRWLIDHLSIPIASLHTGSNLASFAPIDFVNEIWPRPVLIVHGRGQTFVPSDQSMDIYRQAAQPKAQFFPSDNLVDLRNRAKRLKGEASVLSEMFRLYLGSEDNISDDAGVREHTLRFLRDSEPLRVL
jgi:fermentation-respiration switch protein FrsA (DUF1100 family)